MIFNYYPSDIKSSFPLGEITLERLLLSIKNPKPQIKNIFDQIKIADEKTKYKLKTSLYSFTPCVYVRGSRKYQNIVNFTGLLALDFDKLEADYAKEFKEAIFNEYKFIIAAWLSPSRKGVRALVKIPIVNSVDVFKEYFNALEKVLSIYRGWDKAPKNCILPMFLSYDYDLLQRGDATTWTERYSPPLIPVIKQYIVNDKTNNIEAIINSAINKIVDNGHPQLRAASFALGGYVSAGYIDKNYAEIMIHRMIDCNAYLSQKSSVYKRTSLEMIEKGMSKPLYLK